MRVIELLELQKKEGPIYYIREFKGKAVFDCMGSRLEKRIEFLLEHTPLGTIDIHVNLIDEVDFPLLPAVANLKRHILDLEKQGSLP